MCGKKETNYSYFDAKNNTERNAHWVIYSFSLLEHLPYDIHLRYRNEYESGPRQEAFRPLSKIQRYLC